MSLDSQMFRDTRFNVEVEQGISKEFVHFLSFQESQCPKYNISNLRQLGLHSHSFWEVKSPIQMYSK